MFYHLVLTDSCNLCCQYCRAKIFEDFEQEGNEVEVDESLPANFQEQNLPELYSFLKKDSEAVLTFYGGEPLMKLDLVKKILKEAPVKKFMIQTNGLLLHKLSPEETRKFDTILVSIDGDEKTTDKNRGEGIFKRVIENLRLIKKNGFSGELIARMTFVEGNDVFKSVGFLSRNKEFSFNSIHWQVDANFWNDFKARPEFSKWVKESYNPGVKKLARLWVERMEKEGIVEKWYPFLQTTQDLLLEKKSRLRCGSGFENYSILQNGSIVPCPVMVGMKEYYLGKISKTNPKDLRKIQPSGECTECNLLDFCGGRCLYSNIVKPWPLEGRKLVCGMVENLHSSLVEQLPKIRKLLKEGKISLKQFEHCRFNGCEIIP